MATQKHSGPNSAANPPQERPREGEAGQERARLAGLSWLQTLTQDEREAAFAAIRLPGESAAWAPDAHRVRIAREALYQALSVADLLIAEVDRERHDAYALHLGLAVRVRELADAADLLLTGPDACDEKAAMPTALQAIYGMGYRPRATAGAAL